MNIIEGRTYKAIHFEGSITVLYNAYDDYILCRDNNGLRRRFRCPKDRFFDTFYFYQPLPEELFII